MNVACIPHSQIPGTSALFRDYLYRFDRVERFYAHPPELSATARAAREIELAPDHRASLGKALRSQNEGCCDETTVHLDALGEPDTVVVATGQQVGLFGGPALALYKALTAIKIAAKLSEDGLRAVPVFWLATEDHDLAEVDHAWALDAAGEPVRLGSKGEAGPNQPVGGVRFSDAGVAELRSALKGYAFGDEVSDLVEQHYRPGATYGEAFKGFFRSVLGKRGLIFLDPTQREIRELSAPLIRRALSTASELTGALLERDGELEEAGYHRQVLVEESTSLVFLVEDGQRLPLRRQDGGYSIGRRKFSSDELIARLDADSQAFSPNALLRPVVQDHLLPTVVYVGGPAELAYQAQSAVLYDRLLGRAPVLMPRSFVTLLDGASSKLLDRTGLGVPDCFAPSAELREKIAGRLTPPSLKQAFETQGSRVEQALAELGGELESFDRSLSDAFSRSRRKIAYQLEKMRAKAARESLRRDERAASEAHRLGQWLYPNRGLQERTLCYPALAAQFGPGLVESIYSDIAPECPDHQVLAP